MDMNTQQSPNSTGTVVIVDDNPNNLRVLSGILQQDGYKVRPARDGEMALRSIRATLPDLILLDIRMPGIDGYEVCRQLKDDPLTRDVPVIFISALHETEDKVEAFKLGAVDYVAKPFQIEEVLARVNTHMKLAQMQRQLEQLVAERTGELRDSEARYRGVIDQASDMIMLVDREGIVMEANRLAVESLGYRDGELISKSLLEIDRCLSEERFEAVIKATDQGERSIHEGCFAHMDGSKIPVEASIGPVSVEGSTLLLVLGRDITERRLAEKEKEQSRQRLHSSLVQTIEAIVVTLEKRDPYTAGHQKRVAELAEAIAVELGWDDKRREGLRFGALIHDIGKIAVPTEVLNRPGRLSDAEMALVRVHSEEGREIIQGVDFPWPVALMIQQHHERLDGSGYPLGLKEVDIMPEARVLAVADVVEAMASHRPYRPAVGLDKALAEIRSGSGKIYDEKVVDACIALFENKEFEFPAQT